MQTQVIPAQRLLLKDTVIMFKMTEIQLIGSRVHRTPDSLL